jgi:hypothetical protein
MLGTGQGDAAQEWGRLLTFCGLVRPCTLCVVTLIGKGGRPCRCRLPHWTAAALPLLAAYPGSWASAGSSGWCWAWQVRGPGGVRRRDGGRSDACVNTEVLYCYVCIRQWCLQNGVACKLEQHRSRWCRVAQSPWLRAAMTFEQSYVGGLVRFVLGLLGSSGPPLSPVHHVCHLSSKACSVQ